jgi:hypothetical protein
MEVATGVFNCKGYTSTKYSVIHWIQEKMEDLKTSIDQPWLIK